MPIAYAPRMPRPGIPWLLEVDASSGRTTAFLTDRDGQVLNVVRRTAGRAEYDTLASACAAYAVDVGRDLELRWWEGTTLARVVVIELERLGMTGSVEVAEPGVLLRTAAGERRITGAFDLYTWERSDARGAVIPVSSH